MGLLSSFKRKTAVPKRAPAAEDPADAVQRARARARRRLIGAVVLLLVGIIGFPLVFETQPRPIPLDIPIEIPRKDAAPPLVMPPARPGADTPTIPSATEPAKPGAALPGTSGAALPTAAAPSGATSPGARAADRHDEIITESGAEAGHAIAAPAEKSAADQARPTHPAAEVPKAAVAEAAKKPAAADAPKQTAVAEAAKKPAAAEAPKKAAVAAAPPPVEGARARALLDGNGHAAEGGRFVVQVGAFADAGAARELRHRAEKLGLKTYTQVAQTASGSRIRVRVGPFATREEADRALAKARSGGLSAVVLTL